MLRSIQSSLRVQAHIVTRRDSTATSRDQRAFEMDPVSIPVPGANSAQSIVDFHLRHQRPRKGSLILYQAARQVRKHLSGSQYNSPSYLS